MITVVGFSPALDVTYKLPIFVLGTSQRVSTKNSKAGGKCVNVASVLKTLGVKTNLILPLGQDTGEAIKRDLNKRQIGLTELEISKETRTCVAIVAGEATVLNEPATELTDVEYEKFEDLVIEGASKSQIVVFSGSMPANYSKERFSNLIAALKLLPVKVIVDCSGAWLVEAAKAKADFLKPNADELAEIFPNLSTGEALQKLLELGANSVYLSQGSAGGSYVDHHQKFTVQVPQVSGNATGAGDAFVAGFASSMLENLSVEQSLIIASACAGAAVAEDTAGEVSKDLISELKSKIKVVTK